MDLQKILNKHILWIESDGNMGIRANLSMTNLSRTNLSGANLSMTNLSRTNLSGANLSKANLSGANLSGANLSKANLSGANLSGADLYGAALSGTNLSGANLSGADLPGAYLFRANLSGANLSRVDLTGVIGGPSIKLEFQFNKHIASYFGNAEIRIGCQTNTIENWLLNYKRLGKEYNYSDEEIAQYGNFIEIVNKIHNKGN